MFHSNSSCGRKILRTCLLLVLTMATRDALAQGGEKKPLVNSDIIYMVQNHLPEGEIVNIIETSETDFDISPKELINLNSSGVNERIRTAMRKAVFIKTHPKEDSSAVKTTSAAPSSNDQSRQNNGSANSNSTPGSNTNRESATVVIDSIKLDLNKCAVINSRTVCDFTITNSQDTKPFTILTGKSQAEDDTGHHYPGTIAEIASKQAYAPTIDLAKDHPTNAKLYLTAYGIKPILKTLVVRIGLDKQEYEASFENVPVQGIPNLNNGKTTQGAKNNSPTQTVDKVNGTVQKASGIIGTIKRLP